MHTSKDIAYQKALDNYDASFMNNTKWLRLFCTVINAGIPIKQASWKLIDLPRAMLMPFPDFHELLPTRFSDGRFQPFEYKWIESIFVPHRYRPIANVGYEKIQDTTALWVALTSAQEQFPVEQSDTGITIRGYHRKSFG
ncbi:hypothetical protein [Rhizobium sp.]|jgi:hypothetical protein|uniref:hypothetical protein n=1 Tax=Rhizobium sp. TaxID=391 RepID=UPI000E852041|nr:hypothetical protein [Rhizobium sp.]